MPDLSAYLNWNSAGDLEGWLQDNHGAGIPFIINHNPTSITIVRDGAALEPQTCWLGQEKLGDPNEPASDSGSASRQTLVLLGTKDMNIRRGDQFKYPADNPSLNCEVIYVENTFRDMLQVKVEIVQ